MDAAPFYPSESSTAGHRDTSIIWNNRHHRDGSCQPYHIIRDKTAISCLEIGQILASILRYGVIPDPMTDVNSIIHVINIMPKQAWNSTAREGGSLKFHKIFGCTNIIHITKCPNGPLDRVKCGVIYSISQTHSVSRHLI
ncbi:MAG: hypothetical protein C7B46_15470 [Sulfobacillus benefaciens]|uniref:Uncharacterized protein n=1 Tax=Sulfobacillus benefaciens TaxID=453960 RepID=A0A2T2XCD9_9FIRM|nr:MAG: hypothetical protein C7B46_15470 [Sulfobacillus benefaciens]